MSTGPPFTISHLWARSIHVFIIIEAVTIEIAVFRKVTPFSLIECYRRLVRRQMEPTLMLETAVTFEMSLRFYETTLYLYETTLYSFPGDGCLHCTASDWTRLGSHQSGFHLISRCHTNNTPLLNCSMFNRRLLPTARIGHVLSLFSCILVTSVHHIT